MAQTALSRTMAVAQATTNGSGAQGRKAPGTSAAAAQRAATAKGWPLASNWQRNGRPGAPEP